MISNKIFVLTARNSNFPVADKPNPHKGHELLPASEKAACC